MVRVITISVTLHSLRLICMAVDLEQEFPYSIIFSVLWLRKKSLANLCCSIPLLRFLQCLEYKAVYKLRIVAADA